MSQLQIFNFEGSNVRSVIIDGEPHFVAKDVCDVLSVNNLTDALSRLDEDDIDSIEVIDSIGRRQQSKIVNESGLYSLIISSRKPEARRFKRWVTSEVLPTIRKTGSYNVVRPSYMLDDPIERAQRWIEEQQQMRALEQQITDYEPRISYLDELLESEGTVTVSQIAADYGLSAIKLNQILGEEKIQYKARNGKWLPYSQFSECGYMKSVTHLVSDRNMAVMNTRWTQKGRLKIHEILSKRGISPVMDRSDLQ